VDLLVCLVSLLLSLSNWNLGLIKTILSIEKGVIPGNLHFNTPNPQIDFVGMNISVVGKNTPWPDCKVKVRN
jgi:acyl transferase domain-containing protein